MLSLLQKNYSMVELDKDKIQVKYLTELSKTLEGYPTPLDVLYESCVESVDDSLFSSAKMENRYGFLDEDIENVISELTELGYIKKKNKGYKIINTPWS